MTASTVSAPSREQVSALFRAAPAPRHGCAWFVWTDADRDPHKTGGWMSINGQPATWFHRPQDLPADVVWWTNLETPQAWSLGRWTHIKPASFLGPDWLVLLSQWGAPQGQAETAQAVALWSEVFARLAHWLGRWCATLPGTARTPGGPSPDWSWGEGTFSEALAVRLGWVTPAPERTALLPEGARSAPADNESTAVPDDGDLPTVSPRALDLAWLDQVRIDWPSHLLQGKRKVALSLPPLAHARRLRATRYPVGAWRPLAQGQWPSVDTDRWAWLAAQQDRPLLLRFDEAFPRPGQEAALALFWGRRGRRFPGAPQEPVWLTLEEALAARDWLMSAPVLALEADGWQAQAPEPPWPTPDPSDPLEGLSLLSAFKEEAYWRAASTPQRSPGQRKKAAPTPQAVWWRAADRLACLAAARVFQAHGFLVQAYGEGTVTVLFDPQDPATAWGPALLESGVRVPRGLAKDLPAPTGALSPDAMDRWAKQSGQPLETWFMVDRLLWPWLGEDRAQLKTLLAQALTQVSGLPTPPDAGADWGGWKGQVLSRSRQALQAIMPPPKPTA